MIQKRKAAPTPATNLGETASKSQTNNNTPSPTALSPVDLEIDILQHQICIEALRGLQAQYATTLKPRASEIIDLSIALKEVLTSNLLALEEVAYG